MDNVIALVVATLILVAIPGPNVSLIVARSLQHGARAGIVTTFGTTAGVAVQLALVVLGIGAAVELAASALSIIKWAGVIYLVWLGIRAWRRPISGDDDVPDVSGRVAFGQGMMLAVLNPKTLLFNAAFLPQFLGAGESSMQQMLALSVVFLLVLQLGDILWALSAASAQQLMSRVGKFGNKISGGFFIGAGIGLALTRRSL